MSAATDAAGNIVWKENYRPFGDKVNNQSAAADNRQWFHGKAADADTGLQYFGARYYDPVLGRFMGVDPVGFQEDNIHSFNKYAYGNNNPYRFVDPDGRNPILINMGVGALVGAGSAALTNALMQNGPIQWTGYGGVLHAAADGAMLGAVLGIIGGGEAGAAAGAASAGRGEVAIINAQKQAGHIPGTAQNINRTKQGKPTSTFYGEQSGEMATQIANQKGLPVAGRPNVKEYDFGVSVGTGPNGGSQTRVRVHTSPKSGEIHGHPSGPEGF
jgi:RHS repeat-associated protein